MSRIPEGDDEPYPNAWHLFQNRIEQALNGKRGQALLKELEEALVSMPVHRLLYSGFCKDGEVCTLGALGVKREMDKGKTREEALKYLARVVKRKGIERDEEEFGPNGDSIKFAAKRLDMAFSLAWEIIYQNDEENGHKKTPEQRYETVLKWVREHIHPPGWTKPEKVKKEPEPLPPIKVVHGQEELPGFKP